VVIGAGMAGLLAAWALADHCAQVTLVERDALTDSGQARKGVPRGECCARCCPAASGSWSGCSPATVAT
jgi:NADPH-dependent 2,4-dienoyl-CoA reductase/sulfur reductase-like enzyme